MHSTEHFLGKFIPGITIANSKLYEKGDEYVKLRADGWVAVKSKKNKDTCDMLPITLVSADTVKKHYV